MIHSFNKTVTFKYVNSNPNKNQRIIKHSTPSTVTKTIPIIAATHTQVHITLKAPMDGTSVVKHSLVMFLSSVTETKSKSVTFKMIKVPYIADQKYYVFSDCRQVCVVKHVMKSFLKSSLCRKMMSRSSQSKLTKNHCHFNPKKL